MVMNAMENNKAGTGSGLEESRILNTVLRRSIALEKVAFD